jgi:glutamate synthase domain-containing protein 1/glutamate synthase domain-containing protein 3
LMYWETPRDIASCGILGILRRDGASKIKADETLTSIECVRYRGSRYGAGFAAYNLDAGSHYKVKAFVADGEALQHVKQALKEYAVDGFWELGVETPQTKFMSWAAYVDTDEESLRRAVDRVNRDLFDGGLRGRIYSWGRFVEVFKGVGYPSDVCSIYRLVERNVTADLWIAHTRQPTNSPGVYPVWSHPFASHEWAIAHNGDISSFGANMEFMHHRGVSSFVGTDSELIAYILDYLTRHMPVEKAAAAMVNPFEDQLLNGEASGLTVEEYVRWRGALLDGPFSVVAGYCDGEDVYMLAMADRSKFRPLVVGDDGERIYVASEEAEIRSLSEDADVWPVKPGGVFLASMKQGIIMTGREHERIFYHRPRKQLPVGEVVVDAKGLSYTAVNSLVRKHFEAGVRHISLVNVNGHRYLGINVPPHRRLDIHGTAGNCLANFNKGGEITVYGNAQDDVGDAMYGGRVVIHGDARDVVGQALQGGEILVRGSVGNRAAIQMREFKDRRPFLVVGGRADDYLGEYMAGGVVVVLGVDALDIDTCLVGRYMATGMVGGRIYVRGRVDGWRIGLQPPKPDVIRYLRGLALEGLLSEDEVRYFETLPAVSYGDVVERLSGEALRRVSRLFTSKYFRELRVEVRRLDEDVELVGDVLKRFFREFGLDEKLFERVLREEFTVVEPVKKAAQKAEAEPVPEEG